MLNDIKIEDLSARIDLIPLLARWHFKQWGDLTGAPTEFDYKNLLSKNALAAQMLPLTLLAVNHDELLGSVNIVDCDMNIRPDLKPWLAQLFVTHSARYRGIGSTLVLAAVERCRTLGFRYFYLYTSGTLPSFYERLGWTRREAVHYKEKDRTVMEIKLIE